MVENFFVAKSFPRKVWMEKNLVEIFFGREFFLVEKFFVAKSFPRQVWMENNLIEKFFGRKFF